MTNIIIAGSAASTKIINNTIGKSITGQGILWEGTASGNMYNNIILSNALFGIKNDINWFSFCGL